MDEFQRKMSVCKRIGGKPKDLGNDIECEGVDPTKFKDELRKDAEQSGGS